MGPFHDHVQAVVAALQAVGGIRVLPRRNDVRKALDNVLLELSIDPLRRAAQGQRALEFVRSRQGVARRSARRLLARIADARSISALS